MEDYPYRTVPNLEDYPYHTLPVLEERNQAHASTAHATTSLPHGYDLPIPYPRTHTLPYPHISITYMHAFRATESDDDEETLHTNIVARLATEKAKARKKDGRGQFEEDKLNLDISD